MTFRSDAIRVEFPGRLKSANAYARIHRMEARREAKAARTMAFAAMCRVGPCSGAIGDSMAVRITRIAPRRFDDDNMARAAKAIRDGVADWLDIDDGDSRVTWLYAQERGEPKQHAVRIEVFPDVGKCTHCGGLGVAL